MHLAIETYSKGRRAFIGYYAKEKQEARILHTSGPYRFAFIGRNHYTLVENLFIPTSVEREEAIVKVREGFRIINNFPFIATQLLRLNGWKIEDRCVDERDTNNGCFTKCNLQTNPAFTSLLRK